MKASWLSGDGRTYRQMIELRRACAVALAKADPVPVAVGEIARRLHVGLPVVKRALLWLRDRGLVRCVGDSRRNCRWRLAGVLREAMDVGEGAGEGP
jgi:hypothetical protein